MLVISNADVVKLADTMDLGSISARVQVQVLSGAPNSRNPNHILVTSEWFGFAFYLNEIG